MTLDNDDHDLLIELRADIKWIRSSLSEHLRKHWAVSVCVLGALATGVIALLVAILGVSK